MLNWQTPPLLQSRSVLHLFSEVPDVPPGVLSVQVGENPLSWKPEQVLEEEFQKHLLLVFSIFAVVQVLHVVPFKSVQLVNRLFPLMICYFI